MERYRLVIIDDDAAIRYGLRMLVEAMGAEVLAEADSGPTGIEKAEEHRPDLVLLDVSMPGMGGFTTAKKLREMQPDLGIILVSQYSERIYAEEALQMGVNAYVLKRNAGKDLEEAMDAVSAGQTFVSPFIREKKSKVHSA